MRGTSNFTFIPAEQLQISRQTVRTFIQAPRFPEYQKHSQTKSTIDEYRPYLHKRWQEGCRTTGQLWREIQERGFAGSRMMVYRWVQLQQSEGIDQPQQKALLTKKMAPRQLTWLFLHDPDQLEKQEQQAFTLLRQASQIELAYGLTQQFVTMMREHNAKQLDAWLWACQVSGISNLVTFAQGLEQEGSALHAAFTLPYSNGPVEGKINKLKYIKRSMYVSRGYLRVLRGKIL